MLKPTQTISLIGLLLISTLVSNCGKGPEIAKPTSTSNSKKNKPTQELQARIESQLQALEKKLKQASIQVGNSSRNKAILKASASQEKDSSVLEQEYIQLLEAFGELAGKEEKQKFSEKSATYLKAILAKDAQEITPTIEANNQMIVGLTEGYIAFIESPEEDKPDFIDRFIAEVVKGAEIRTSKNMQECFALMICLLQNTKKQGEIKSE